MTGSAVFLINVLSTWYMVGVIWTVQLVHYKLFNRIGSEQFVGYEKAHCNAMSFVVIPAMLPELASSIWLALATPTGLSNWAMSIGLVAVILIWVSTFALQVPCHQRLTCQFTETDYRRLVGTNWIRTVLWSFRGMLTAYGLLQLIGDPL
ncbi:hypothetical protein [Roseiconus lacunae]|uniref:hypothetical protein n=1 Tax=Roseiconus lacunae TaxID=2605694 RepID=UPI0011F2E213|nr:hypothetical protein [Roseiconus lacunae]MCD0459520.1 hypothetical protein [Roseiconus lacunae]